MASISTPRRNLLCLTSELLLACSLLTVTGCGLLPKNEAGAQQRSSREGRNQGPAAVDVAIAQTAPLEKPREYTGTTQPFREVSLRAQVEGQLLSMTADVGDRIQQGQVVAQIDDDILQSTVLQEEAELAALQSEVSQAQSGVSDARTRVEQARLQLQQAESDASRLQQLARDGAIPLQQAEQARTTAKSNAQVVRSTQEQLRNQEQAIAAAQGRVVAQQAVVSQAQERRSYTVMRSPITGFVLERISETGNLIQPGGAILKLGDLSQAKIAMQVSDLEISRVRVGQSVQVRLDAFPNRQFTGTVRRISPAANPTSRLIPIEVTVPNPSGQIGSGLLARVSFTPQGRATVVVPEMTLQVGRSPGQGRSSDRQDNNEKRQPQTRRSTQTSPTNPKPQTSNNQTRGTLFVIAGDEKKPTVQARSVVLGQRADSRVEILSGLKPGERYVMRSGKPLKEGDPVRLSILSKGGGSQKADGSRQKTDGRR